MLRRTMQIPIWPRCCGFIVYFWEGQRGKQLFLELGTARFWLHFFLEKGAWGTSLMGREHSTCRHLLLRTCPALSACINELNLPHLLQVPSASLGARRGPWHGVFCLCAELGLGPGLKQRLLCRDELPRLLAQGKGTRGRTRFSACATVSGRKNKLHSGVKKCDSCACAPRSARGSPQAGHSPPALTSLHFHVFKSHFYKP